MKKTLCIVDDDFIYRYALSKQIQNVVKNDNERIKVISFSDGEEAINYINKSAEEDLPDTILLDLNMPIMDGFQFMEEYVKIKPKVGKKIMIYIVTSSFDQSDIDRAKSIEDVTDYIIKPITTEHLFDILNIV